MVKRRQKHRKEQTATADAALPSYRKKSAKENLRNFLLHSKMKSSASCGQLHSPDSELYRCSSGPVSATDACSYTRCRDCAGWGHVATASYIQKPAHTHTLLKLVYPGENFTNYYETMNKVHTHAQTHRIPCYGIETACTIFWRGCRQHSGQRGVNPGTVARPLCCSLWLTPPPLLGRTWLQRK